MPIKITSQNKVCFRNNRSFTGNVATALKKIEYTDNAAIDLFKKELKGQMPNNEIDEWVQKIKNICIDLKISPKNLPINKEHPGNLTIAQNKNLLNAIFSTIIK